MNKGFGFSLVELMVVIAIVAILAAVAVPAYKVYLYNSKLSAVVTILKGQMDRVIATYEQSGSFPQTSGAINRLASVYDGGITSSNGISPYIDYFYYGIGHNGADSVVVQAYISNNVGQYIPGFVVSNGTYFSCTSCKITLAARLVNNVWKYYCGSYSGDGDTTNIPSSYLISGCNVSNISTTW